MMDLSRLRAGAVEVVHPAYASTVGGVFAKDQRSTGFNVVVGIWNPE